MGFSRAKIAVVTILSSTFLVFAAQELTNGKGSKEAPVATVRSSSGLILNGVRTPAGVTSVIVKPGDVLDTLGEAAVATYPNGKIVNLAAGTQYTISRLGGGEFSAGRPNGLNTRVSPQLNISGHK